MTTRTEVLNITRVIQSDENLSTKNKDKVFLRLPITPLRNISFGGGGGVGQDP